MRILFAFCFALTLLGKPPDASDCVACHDTIDLGRFRAHTHGGLACVDCHTAITALPHPEKLPPVACARCHDHQVKDYANSVHGLARAKGNEHAATCQSCHGRAHDLMARDRPDSRIARKNMAATCGACHEAGFLEKLSTKLSKRRFRMDLQAFPK